MFRDFLCGRVRTAVFTANICYSGFYFKRIVDIYCFINISNITNLHKHEVNCLQLLFYITWIFISIYPFSRGCWAHDVHKWRCSWIDNQPYREIVKTKINVFWITQLYSCPRSEKEFLGYFIPPRWPFRFVSL